MGFAVKKKINRLQDSWLKYLLTGEEPKLDIRFFILKEKGKEKLCDLYKGAILPRWIKKYPWTRPFAWWEFDAPRNKKRKPEIHKGHEKYFPKVRKMVNGRGKLYSGLFYRFGVPCDWAEIDTADPPLYETEGVYLKRHGLLTKEEEKLMKKSQKVNFRQYDSIINILKSVKRSSYR